MQLLIDTETTPAYQLEAIIKLLQDVVDARGATPPVDYSQPLDTPEAIKEFDGLFGAEPVQPEYSPPLAQAVQTVDTVTGPVFSTATQTLGDAVVSNAREPVSIASLVAPQHLDSAGIPWDKRIHSESKNTVADGTWRKKRGIDPAYYDSVIAEWRGAPMLNAADVAYIERLPKVAPPPPPATSNLAAVQPVPAPSSSDVRPPQSPPVTPQLLPNAPDSSQPRNVPPLPAEGAIAFRALMIKAAGLITAKKLTNSDLLVAIQTVSGGAVQSAQGLLSAPEYIPLVMSRLDALAGA